MNYSIFVLIEFMDRINTWTNKAIDCLQQGFDNLAIWFKKTFLHPGEAMKTVYLLTVVGLCCFGYTWVTHSFTVPLGGDYTLQEMTFLFNGYDDWHTFFRTGVFPTWDRSIFLGVDQVGANSFYYLFDPFFLIMLIFPRDWLLTLQGLAFVPKLVIGGMLFYWYLKEFDISPRNRRVGALAYGFCGWSFVYLWFHFIDSAALFPLVLLGVERILKNHDPRIFFVGFLLNAMASYFFFVVFMFGAFFYAVFRYLQTVRQRESQENWALFGLFFLSFLVAVFLGCFVLLPGMNVALGMPRSNSNSWLNNIKEATSLGEMFKAIFSYSSIGEYHRLTPLVNFLFMPNNCFYSNLMDVTGYDNMAASMYTTIPMLLMFFVGLVDAIKEKKTSYIIGILLVLLLVFSPIGFYLFSGFTVGYARYFIVPMTYVLVFDLMTIEKRRKLPTTYLDISFAIVMFLDIISAFLVVYYENTSSSAPYWDYKMIEIVLTIPWVFVCYIFMRRLFHKKEFSRAMMILTAIDVIVMANVTITFQGTVNTDSMAGGPSNISEETKIVELLKSDENNEDYYRISNPTADRYDINISLREGYNGLGAFHSVYAFGAQDFLVRSRIPYGRADDWSMGVHNRRMNMETFLGTKYYLVPKADLNDLMNSKEYDIPYGYVNILKMSESEKIALGVNYSEDLLSYLSSSSCDKDLYVNKNFVDFAFPYDTVINADWLCTDWSEEKTLSWQWNRYEDINEYPLLRYAMLDDEDYQTFYKKKKYNTGSYTANGVTTTLEYSTTQANATKFVQSLVTSDSYVKGNSAPIEYVGGKNKLQATVYSAQWPSTSGNVGGDYLQWPSDYDTEEEKKIWISNHQFEYKNGISAGDVKFDYDTLKDDSGNTDDSYSRDVLWYSKIVLTPKDSEGNPTTVCTEATSDDPTSGCYISVRNSATGGVYGITGGEDDSNCNIEWRLFDADGNLISKAIPSFDSYKNAHGYYTDRPVAKLVGIVYQGNKTTPASLGRPSLYIQRDSDYQAAIDSLKSEPVTISSRNDNTVNFTTNYSKNKFVVLNYPYQNGWTLTKKNVEKDSEDNEVVTYKEVTTYKAQGGFIGFEASSGEGEYILNYKSPYFSTGMAITALGVLISFVFFVAIGIKNRYSHYNDPTFTLMIETEKTKKIIKYKEDDCDDGL